MNKVYRLSWLCPACDKRHALQGTSLQVTIHAYELLEHGAYEIEIEDECSAMLGDCSYAEELLPDNATLDLSHLVPVQDAKWVRNR